MPATCIDFPPFQLDLRAWQLRRDGEPVSLRPKTFSVLKHLAERPGQLVTKAELLEAVWTDVTVSEDVLRVSTGEIRAALGDSRSAARFLQTVPGRGYRFVARMGSTAAAPSTRDDRPPVPDLVVGRERERADFAAWLGIALRGERQTVFVTGEAGIGKTTLVDTALRDLASSSIAVRVARGQCVELYGGGEPYKPVLDAFTALASGAGGKVIADAVRGRAPGWLLETLGAGVAAAGAAPVTYEHTLHTLAATVVALAADTPLVLVFEDVQWSDYSTLDLLSVLALGREPARLLVVCTLRLTDAIVRGHPLVTVRRELLRKRQCRELALGGLPTSDVAQYLAARFPNADLPGPLLSLLAERSDGNPFFVVTLLDHLLDRGMLVEDDGRWTLRGTAAALRAAIPDGLRAVVEPRLDALTADERNVLDAASVAGPRFAAHAIADAASAGGPLGDVEGVEASCDGLARRELLRSRGELEWPDGRTSAQYEFRHALYQQVLDERLTSTRRRRLHQTIGEQLESGFAGRTVEVASRLAAHFQASGDTERSVRYHGEAAAHARSRCSHQETRLHLEHALDLMRGQSETHDRLQRRVPMLSDLAWTSFASRGWGDAGAAEAFAQMRALAERFDDAEARFKAMEGELTLHAMRAEYAIARTRGEAMLALAEQIGSRAAIAAALPSIGAVSMHMGDVDAAEAVAERGRTLADPDDPTDNLVGCCNLLASTLAYRGRIAEARAANHEAIALAARSGLPYLQAQAALYAGTVLQLMGDVPGTRRLVAETERIATELGFGVFAAVAALYRGWCDVRDGRIEEGVAVLRPSLDAYVASGQRISASVYGLIAAEAYLAAGDHAAAQDMLDTTRAFVGETGERLCEHELHRLQGECLLAGPATRSQRAEAVACFERAIVIAAGQRAVLFELRATASLFRVRPASARPRLAALIDGFAPADDYPELRAAADLLATTRR